MSLERALNMKFWFGKYNGKFLVEVAKTDPDYMVWVIVNMGDNVKLLDAITFIARERKKWIQK